MKRTAGRPVASGRMSREEAWVFAIITGLSGTVIMWQWFNLASALIALFSLFLYAFIYTPLKKINWISVLVGAFPGALPCLIGWVAGTGFINPVAHLQAATTTGEVATFSNFGGYIARRKLTKRGNKTVTYCWLWMFRSQWAFLEAKHFYGMYAPAALDRLERERGLHIAHTYLETYHPPHTKFGLKNLIVPVDPREKPGGPGRQAGARVRATVGIAASAAGARHAVDRDAGVARRSAASGRRHEADRRRRSSRAGADAGARRGCDVRGGATARARARQRRAAARRAQ